MRRWVLLAVATALAVMAIKLLLEDILGIPFEAFVTQALANPGAGAATAVIGLLVVDLFLPIPSSVVMVLSGAVFGVTKGAALSMLGAMGRSILGFELARRYGRSGAARLLGDREISSLERTFDRYGAGAVFMTRPLPIVQETMSVIAGLSAMRRGPFLLATIAGTIPEVVLYAYAGSVSRETGSMAPALLILVTLAGIGWMVYRGRAKKEA
jgi:uncharacterized membrane protein YdjX (TVP38/TMEM64 family)